MAKGKHIFNWELFLGVVLVVTGGCSLPINCWGSRSWPIFGRC
jgi:hypothetical protein